MPDEVKKMADLNFRLAVERPVELDRTVSDSEWDNFRRIVHFYADFRLKKVRYSPSIAFKKMLCFAMLGALRSFLKRQAWSC